MASFNVITSKYLPKIEDGFEYVEKKVKREGGFWKRLFDHPGDPTVHMWDDYVTVLVKVPKYLDMAYVIKATNTILMSTEALTTFSGAIMNTEKSFTDFTATYRKVYNIYE